RDFYAEVIKEVNALNKAVMAIDIPSGLNADTGQIMGTAIKADLTVAFGYPKVGELLFPGADLVGRLVRVDIGIPEMVAGRVPGYCSMTEPTDFLNLLNPEREDIHKGNRGHLLILAGSKGKTGAAALTSLGAVRAGVGLVTLGIPESLNHIMEVKLTETMTTPLPETAEGSLSLEALKKIDPLLEGKTALAIGPGLSTHEETAALVRQILKKTTLPVVIDADGINALAGNLSVLEGRQAPTILTPHPGEMGRLIGVKSADLQNNRIDCSARFVDEWECHLVLKGARTLITDPDGTLHVNPTGNPALASGGTGDVLTGLIGGFLARGWPPATAAMGGVYLHGLAADLLAEEMGGTGILAGELLNVLPELMSLLSQGEWPMEQQPPHADFYRPL
ncbi:NAD(P)H-hydrate dehydratase, partial [Thermodesulfobacteriota bacterium]